MLKFFRKYNKWLLAVLGSFLMVIFLLPQDFGRGNSSLEDITRGTYDGGIVTQADLNAAKAELDIIARVGQGTMVIPIDDSGGPDTLAWELMKAEARQMGIQVSDFQVDEQLLSGALQLTDETAVQNIANGASVSTEFVRDAFRNWLMVMQYQELALGRTHTQALQRISFRANAMQLAAQARQNPFAAMMNPRLPQLIQSLDQTSYGSPRASEPLIERTMYDNRATATIKAVRVGPEEYNDEVTVDPAKVKELFDKYKNDLEGTSKPYGFGYKFPNRVKIEYLVIPADRLEDKIREEGIDDRKVFEYYKNNKSSYPVDVQEENTGEVDDKLNTDIGEAPDTDGQGEEDETGEPSTNGQIEDGDSGTTTNTGEGTSAPEAGADEASATEETADEVEIPAKTTEDAGNPESPAEDADKPAPAPDVSPDVSIKYKPFEEVYDEIKQTLVADQARERSEEMARAILAMLGDDARQLPVDPKHSQYRDTTDFEPMSLAEVADEIAADERFVRPDIVRLDRKWMDPMELSRQKGISRAAFDRLSFPRYVLEEKTFALDRPEDTRIPGVRLQAKLPSEPLENFQTGDRYIFRIIEADLAHAPTSLDEVREDVEKDAKDLAAYALLKERAEKWQAMLVGSPTDSVANVIFTEVLDNKYQDRLSAEVFSEIQGLLAGADTRNQGPSAIAIGVVRLVAEEKFGDQFSEETRKKFVEIFAKASEEDASLNTVYRQLTELLDDTDIDSEDLEELVIDIATDLNELYIDAGPFPRRQQDQSGRSLPPTLPGVGQNADFIAAVFDLATELSKSGLVKGAEKKDRVRAIPVDMQQAVYVVELTDYTALTGSEYREQVTESAGMRFASAAALQSIIDDEVNMFDLDALKKRLNYKSEDVDEESSDDQSADDETAAGASSGEE